MFGESVAGPKRAHRHPVPGQLVRRAGRRADAPAHGDRDERAHQNPSDGMHVAAVASASCARYFPRITARATERRDDDDDGQAAGQGVGGYGRLVRAADESLLTVVRSS